MSIETKISTFIQTQFPEFYLEEGPNFVAFVTAYYEWLERDDNPVGMARSIPKFSDVDTAIDKFIEHYTIKYLQGVPASIKGDKRFIIKHILDVYRSKGSVQGYKLLFRLLYNEDIDVYLPSTDMLRPSDGTWYSPTYLEVAYNGDLANYVGKIIRGSSSQAEAVVEEYVHQPVNGKVINILYLSNVFGQFSRGEKIVIQEDFGSLVSVAPVVLGSLSSIQITSGGQQFNIGDTLIATTGSGVEAEARVSAVANGTGTLLFDIINGGSLYTVNASAIITRTPAANGLVVGRGASFDVGTLTNIQQLTFNTDLIMDYANVTVNATDYGFATNAITDASSNVGFHLNYETEFFGTIVALDNISTGNNYAFPPKITVKDYLYSKNLVGNVFYSNTSSTITGVGTNFTSRFAANSVIKLVADPVNVDKIDYRIVKTVTSDTSMVLDDFPTFTSNGNITSLTINSGGTGYANTDTVTVTGSGTGAVIKIVTNNTGLITATKLLDPGSGYMTAPTLSINTTTGTGGALSADIELATFNLAIPLLRAQFVLTSITNTDGSISGENASITGDAVFGTGIIKEVQLKNSGFGYTEAERVDFATYGAISDIAIVSRGLGYANGDILVFSGGGAATAARGTVTTNDTGEIMATALSYAGSGYKSIPNLSVLSATGHGADLNPEIGALNTLYRVSGIAVTDGRGKSKGYWTTNRGFLNSDKFIQDSFYYQEYSYEIQAPIALERYADVLKKTFHIAGTELFGKVVLKDTVASVFTIKEESITQD